MTLPTFLVIGVAKAGTSSLHAYLDQHPDVYMSPMKEPEFFIYDGDPNAPADKINDLDAYKALFAEAGDAKARGESSVDYLEKASAATRIQNMLPDARLLAILRNPVDRAYSAYQMWSNSGHDLAPSFAAAIQAEREGTTPLSRRPYVYGRPGYCELLAPYLTRFPREQIKLSLYEDYRAAPRDFIADVFRFIDVDPSFEPDLSRQHNQGGQPRNRLIGELLRRPNPVRFVARTLLPDAVRIRGREALRRVNRAPARPVDPSLRAELTEVVRDDIERLQDLMDRDLSHWLAT